jgi:hypothetical protein
MTNNTSAETPCRTGCRRAISHAAAVATVRQPPEGALQRRGLQQAFQLKIDLSSLNNGHLHTALDYARADGVAGETGRIMNVELLHEMLPVFFNGLDADV